MSLTHLVRAEFLRARNFDYVKAARALAFRRRIMVRHVLPNALISSMTMIPFLMSGGVTALTTLDFLGFGCRPARPRSASCCCKAKATRKPPGSASPALSHRLDAGPHHLHRRSRPRRLRSRKEIRR